jgi:hypothetical protein
MQASKALSAGEWKKAAEFINSIKIWELMADSEKIKEMLSSQIQEEGLRTYLFTYAPFYDTLSITTLAGMFELSERKVSAVVSKMISHEELAAALDQVNSAISSSRTRRHWSNAHKEPPTPLRGKVVAAVAVAEEAAVVVVVAEAVARGAEGISSSLAVLWDGLSRLRRRYLVF